MIWTRERSSSQETQDWLDQLREDHGREREDGPAGAAGTEREDGPAGAAGTEPETPWWPAPASQPSRYERGAVPEPGRYPARPRVPAQEPWPGDGRPGEGRADPLLTPIEVTERAVIGDELRRPVVWCQAGYCIGRHTDPDALGEADARARAISAGWREDRFGRLVCPACQQSKLFWAARPLIPWDREMAVTMTWLMAAAVSDDAVGAAGAETGVLPAALPVAQRAPAADGARPGRRGTGRHRRVR